MRYEGNTCPGCGEIFTSDDDVVVCPECATAQHRACYNKKGECVNAHLHSQGFQWAPEKDLSQHSTSTLVNQEKNKKTFQCPNCGTYCDPEEKQCSKCGTKFVLFGVNIAKQIIKEQEKIDRENGVDTTDDKESDIPAYKPPFEIGKGEGFDKETETTVEVKNVAVQNVQNEIINALTGEGRYSKDNEGKLNFTGPFRVDDEIEGVSANAIGSFVRTEAFRYIEKFRKISLFSSNTCNWGAFVFAPYWFFYRRLFKPGVIFMTLNLIIGLFTTYFSYDVMAKVTEMEADLSAAMTDEAIYELFVNELSGVTACIMGCMLATVVLRLVAGFIGDKLYKKYVFENVRIMQKKSDMNEALLHAARFGGASTILAMGSFFAYQMLTYAIGMFFV